jgi:hypothetical protein
MTLFALSRSYTQIWETARERMGVIVKIKVCAECFQVTAAEPDGSAPVSPPAPEISDGLRLWEDYEFTPCDCSYVDFLNDTSCCICRRSLTKDRRQMSTEPVAVERRVWPGVDRRTPFGRGSRVLLATVRAA